jgi:galactokinase
MSTLFGRLVHVQVARAFNLVFNLRLSCEGEMQYAYHGERLTPSMCGRMDQCGAFGKVPLLMTFDGDSFTAQKLQLRCPLHLILVDLRWQ